MSHNHLSWLQQLGFDEKVAGKYAAIFDEHDLEFDQIKELNHEILRDIGIVTLGHRLKILKFAHKEKNLMEKLLEGVNFLQQTEKTVPLVGIILHTGLTSLLDELENAQRILLKDIPNFPSKNSNDSLIIGTLVGKRVVIIKGNHYYDGYSIEDIVFPVRLFKLWGVQKLFICSTVGSLKSSINPGDIVLIDHHINLLPNPLIGDNEPSLGPRWPHGKDPYHLDSNTAALEIAKKNNINAHRGVYMCISGPSGSTRAELKAWQLLGADVVGHSVAPEAVACMHLKLRVISICIAITSEVPDGSFEIPDEEYLRIASDSTHKIITILKGLLQSSEKTRKSNKFIQQGEGLVLHGNKYYHKQNYNKALEFYKLALEKEHYQPAIWNIHNRLCATYTRLKDYHNALEQAELMIKAKPDHAKGYLRRGGAYFFLGKTQLALEDYLQAQTLNDKGNGEDINTTNLESYIAQAREKLSKT